MTGSAFMLPPADGACRVCFCKHEPEGAHNAQSISYAMRFQAAHGRGVTWYDAVAHLPDEKLRNEWVRLAKEAYEKHGLHWPELPDGCTAIAEPYEEHKPGMGAMPMPSMQPTVVKMEGKPKRKQKPKKAKPKKLFVVEVNADVKVHDVAERMLKRIRETYTIDASVSECAEVLARVYRQHGACSVDVCWWEEEKQFSIQVRKK